MKTELATVSLRIALFLIAGTSSHAQGTFQNLDFESANIPKGTQPGLISASNALPGWSVTGTPFSPYVFYDDISLGAPAVSLLDSNYLELILQGKYSVLLSGSSAGPPGAVSIGQTGQIPAGTQSLLFYGAQIVNLQVSFSGQSLSYVPVGSGPNYTVYGANISEYAGQTGQLLFSGPPNSGGIIDNIQFSPSSIPEPASWAVMFYGLGAGLAAWRCKQER